MDELQAIVEELLRETRASRVTLRLAAQDGYFGVAREALAPGAPSLRGEHTVSLRANRVAQRAAAGEQVVFDDTSAVVSDDPDFERMLAVYGGLAAQVVTPVQVDGEVVGIVSVHQLRTPRYWTAEEIELCNAAVARIAAALAYGATTAP